MGVLAQLAGVGGCYQDGGHGVSSWVSWLCLFYTNMSYAIFTDRKDAKSPKAAKVIWVLNRRDAEAQRIFMFSLRLCVSAVPY